MNRIIFKEIELNQWIRPDLTVYFLAADEDEIDILRDDYEQDNIKFLSWDTLPNKTELTKIQALVIFEPESGQYDISDLPQWVNTLSNLRVLALPYVCIHKLKDTIENSISTLETLNFFNPIEWEDEKFEIPLNWRMPKLSSFISGNEINGLFGLTQNNAPNISYLQFDLSKYKNIAQLKEIENFNKLEHIRLSNGKSLEILGTIPNKLLQSISLVGFKDQNISISEINKFKNLKYIHLNGFKKTEIDCELFVNLEFLIYLDLISCFNLKNVNRLLDLKKLQQLTVLDCKSPFSQELVHSLKKSNIKNVNIDYA